MTASSASRKRRSIALGLGSRHPLMLFFRGFLKHPAMVGSIIPSSAKLVEHMLSPVDWSKTRLFVEYGPGVGTYTQTVLDLLGPDAELIAIDTNPEFVDYLRRDIKDPRLHVVRGSAADVRRIIQDFGHEQADYILSGLPFSTLPDGVGPRIVEETQAVLRPGGAFLVYQFSGKVIDFLRPVFPRIERGIELVNIPPVRLFWAWKD